MPAESREILEFKLDRSFFHDFAGTLSVSARRGWKIRGYTFQGMPVTTEKKKKPLGDYLAKCTVTSPLISPANDYPITLYLLTEAAR